MVGRKIFFISLLRTAALDHRATNFETIMITNTARCNFKFLIFLQNVKKERKKEHECCCFWVQQIMHFLTNELKRVS